MQGRLAAGDYPALLPHFDPRVLQGDGYPVYSQLWADVAQPRELLVSDIDQLIVLAIKPAVRTSRTDPLPLGFGGPFGALCAIPEILMDPATGRKTEFRTWYPTLSDPNSVHLPLGQVEQWRVIAFGTNMVHPLGNPLLHAEAMAQSYASRAVGGRNFWKRFVLVATTGAPCGMCAASFKWSMPRWIVSGDSLSGAVDVGFHEAQSVLESDGAPRASAPIDSWVSELRASGIEVVTHIQSALVENELYRPYTGVVYNSGPDDPTG